MTRARIGLLVIVILGAAVAAYYWLRPGPTALVLTGMVTTTDVVVGPQIAGQLTKLSVKEGDTVTRGQLLATIFAGELSADSAYYTDSAEGVSSQVQTSEAALRFQERQTADSIAQAEASFASADAAEKSAEADLERTQQTLDRNQTLLAAGVASVDDLDHARTAQAAAKAHVESLKKQADAAQAAVLLARSNAEQNAMRRSQVQEIEHQRAAAEAQKTKAGVRLGYADVLAPIDGVVDVRAAREGEVLTAGQPIVTLINPDDLWVRVDVEETYIDRVKLGDTLTVRLPSGVDTTGTVFLRGVDAGFATQRDVSRTKRDIKTFEVRLRVDNHDRRLALGMTAYVLLPIAR
jgi:multidrug resistance efflux pump